MTTYVFSRLGMNFFWERPDPGKFRWYNARYRPLSTRYVLVALDKWQKDQEPTS